MPAKKITKTKPVEREYIVPFRREISKVPRYKRTPKAVKAIKQFIARHMRIPERDISRVKIDKWLNQELWFRGIKNPPHKIKVKARYDGENVKVELMEFADNLKYKKAREDKIIAEAKKTKKEKKAEEKAEKEKKEKSEEEKEEKEKSESGAEVARKVAKEQHKTQKHTQIQPKQPKSQPIRKTLKK